MQGTITAALESLKGALTGKEGIDHSLQALRETYSIPFLQETLVEIVKAPTELDERSRTLRYPRICLSIERVENGKEERFRRFAGTLRAAVEVRVSQDRIDGITESLYWYIDALRDVIERKAGCLGEGLVLTGDYDIQVDAVKKGGLNFLQIAKMVCPLVMSRS